MVTYGVSEEYANAYAEVWEVLKNLIEEDYEKIPQSYIEYIDTYRSSTCGFKYDHSKEFEEQPLSDVAKYILFGLFEKFGATLDQRVAIQKFREQKQRELRIQKYGELMENDDS